MKPKRLVLSRKGFDSGSGGCPSPIFPDGSMFSLPIPDASSHVAYRALRHGGVQIGRLAADLTRNRITPEHRAHLDPDIDRATYPRKEGWRPVFGTSRSAQGHLHEQQVCVGDLFLFFGLYRRVERIERRWQFVRSAPRQHVLWGWLQIGEMHYVDSRTKSNLPWAVHHPHLSDRYTHPNNALYVASERLDLGDRFEAPGAGPFIGFNDALVLTEPNQPVTHWRLPGWFYPSGGRTPLTYHGDLERWRRDGAHACLRNASRGQEFVLRLDEYPEALGWVSALIRDFRPM